MNTVAVLLTHHDEDGGRSVIYIMDVVLPQKGIGMNLLLGSQETTLKYLNLSDEAALPTANVKSGAITTELQTLLGAHKVEETEKQFEIWLSLRMANQKKDKTLVPEDTVKKIVEIVLTAASQSTDVEMEDETEVPFEAEEAKPLRFTGPYASNIMRVLIDRGLVKDIMWPGGVVQAGLLLAQDWVSHSHFYRCRH